MSIDKMIEQLIVSKNLSQDKLCTIELISNHIKKVRDRKMNEKSYIAPVLFVTEEPGTDKTSSYNKSQRF